MRTTILPNHKQDITIRLKEQIVNGLKTLQDQRLIYTYNYPLIEKNRDCFRITYPNHQSGVSFSNHAYGSIGGYLSFLSHEEYTCIFSDALILQIYYEFDDNRLCKHRLTWWLCPIFVKLDEANDIPPLDLIDSLGVNWKTHLVQRSPVRFDFEAQRHHDSDNHPASHLHFNDKSCRILVSHPLCFNRFIGFIFDFFYSDIRCKLSREILWNKPIISDIVSTKAFLRWK
jgi:hypothetical protein